MNPTAWMEQGASFDIFLTPEAWHGVMLLLPCFLCFWVIISPMARCGVTTQWVGIIAGLLASVVEVIGIVHQINLYGFPIQNADPLMFLASFGLVLGLRIYVQSIYRNPQE